MHQILLEVPETHRNISRSLWEVLTHLQVECQHSKLGQVEKIHGGVGRISISASIRVPCTKFLVVPETHKDISRSLGRC